MAAEITIRFATKADAAGVARVYTETWTAAFQNIVPQDHIAAINANRYERVLKSLPETEPVNSDGILTIAAVSTLDGLEGQVIGVAAFGSTRDPKYSPTHPLELFSLYVLPEFHGRGVPLRMIRKGAELLGWYSLDPAKAKMVCQVFEMNERAMAFYKKIGGSEIGREITSRYSGHVDRVIIAMGWDSVPA
ncbi:hypothetical protein HK100_004980 [Physocladia obscura]|uniref:N-acetyltransferase domain-containing protein n=1 Tax=Physocladia obscura TaxID=109957 RepID=A0AAD5SS67_9FUNG|nr:hypothetical protein HK100_004980 [Physocladia obscura]